MKTQKLKFFYEIWSKNLKMAKSQPLLLLGQNPLGCEVLIHQGSQPYPSGLGPGECPFRLLMRPEKNGHLTINEAVLGCADFEFSCGLYLNTILLSKRVAFF